MHVGGRGAYFGDFPSGPAYMQHTNDNILVIAQIEDVKVLQYLDSRQSLRLGSRRRRERAAVAGGGGRRLRRVKRVSVFPTPTKPHSSVGTGYTKHPAF
jgi:hypothetical protein